MKRIVKTSTVVLTVLLLLTAVSIGAYAQEDAKENAGGEKKAFSVPKVDKPIKIDGVIDEEAWKNALRFEPSIELRPGENTEAPVRTVALVAYSDTHFYVAVHAYDPDPSAIRARYSDRDKIWNDDWIAIVLDTFSDKRHIYNFVVNPFGIQGETIESISGHVNVDWDTIWKSSGRIVDDGYVVEVGIPFSSLRIQRKKGIQVWGFDLTRNYPRNFETLIGLFARPRNYNCYTCLMEKISGHFASKKRGKNIEIAPSLSAVDTRARNDDWEFEKVKSKVEPGISAQWKFTPNMTLNATVNPDFSQVEADAAEMDVNTQFSIYYPEKRPFFLEGGSIFETRLPVIRTRSLALPDWGIKVTGKEGPHSIGFFTVQDQITNLIIPGSYGNKWTSLDMKTQGSVLRYRHDIGKVSAVGAIFTDREGEDYYNRVAGFDTYLRLSDTKEVRAQLMTSQTRYPGAVTSDPEYGQSPDRIDGTALELFYRHTSPKFIYYATYQQASPGFRADMGFYPQVGYRHLTGGMVFFWYRNPGHWFTKIHAYPSFQYETDFDDNLIFKTLKFNVNYAGPSQSSLSLEGRLGKRALYGTEYDISQVEANFSIQPSGPLYLWVKAIYGNEIDFNNVRQGRMLLLNPGIYYKLGKRLSFLFQHEFERMEVDNRRLYTANVSNFRMVYQFSKRAFFRAVLRYKNYDFNVDNFLYSLDPEYQNLITQFLFSYKINPQTMLFLGYSDDNIGFSYLPLTQTSRTFFLKIGYAFRM